MAGACTSPTHQRADHIALLVVKGEMRRLPSRCGSHALLLFQPLHQLVHPLPLMAIIGPCLSASAGWRAIARRIAPSLMAPVNACTSFRSFQSHFGDNLQACQRGVKIGDVGRALSKRRPRAARCDRYPWQKYYLSKPAAVGWRHCGTQSCTKRKRAN